MADVIVLDINFRLHTNSVIIDKPVGPVFKSSMRYSFFLGQPGEIIRMTNATDEPEKVSDFY